MTVVALIIKTAPAAARKRTLIIVLLFLVKMSPDAENHPAPTSCKTACEGLGLHAGTGNFRSFLRASRARIGTIGDRPCCRRHRASHRALPSADIGGTTLMKRDKRATRQGTGVIQDELARIEAEIASLGQSLGSTASSEARAALSSIRERLDRIAGSAGGMTRAGVDAVESTIQDNPFTSLAREFGVGLAVALLIRRW